MKNTLLTDFFTELSSTYTSENSSDFKCRVRLNPDHPVYKGHFPQIPIAPGVCLTQMLKEILMEKFQEELVMKSGDNIKFLAMINPKETPELEITFSVKKTDATLDVNATYSNDSRAYTKFKGKFSIGE
ncbi:3-hydroxyacyl-ACP dehydratase [Sphingobacteriaceae bacterium]|nr:3-hydroxyacyl-ACP dehydratase [Sphingobacteriaceae bacterium]